MFGLAVFPWLQNGPLSLCLHVLCIAWAHRQFLAELMGHGRALFKQQTTLMH